MRRALVAAALVLLMVSAGCLGGGGDQLNEDASYDWNTSAVATYDVVGTTYHALYRVDRGQTIEVYQTVDIGGEQSVSISALQFRYENGSVLRANGTIGHPDGSTSSGPEIPVESRGDRTAITAPADGTLAYSAQTRPKSFRTPILVDGSHEVILPEDIRISVPILGIASPGGYERTMEDGRVRLRWAETPGETIDLRYYLQRDFYIYAGLVLALLALGVVGVVYFRIQIRRLEREREEVGIDVDT